LIDRKQAEEALHRAQAELAHVTRVATLGEMTASIAISQPAARRRRNNATACLHWLAAQTWRKLGSPRVRHRRQPSGGEIIGRIRALIKKAPSRKTGSTSTRPSLSHRPGAREVQSKTAFHYGPGSVMSCPHPGRPNSIAAVILNLMINAIEAMNEVDDAPREC